MSTYTPFTNYKTQSFSLSSGSGTIFNTSKRSVLEIQITSLGGAADGYIFSTVSGFDRVNLLTVEVDGLAIVAKPSSAVILGSRDIDYNLSSGTIEGIIHIYEID